MKSRFWTGLPLMNGFLLHPEKSRGKAAALDAVYGRGHMILTGLRPQWRDQTHQGMQAEIHFGRMGMQPAICISR